jgi:hypothetical protein
MKYLVPVCLFCLLSCNKEENTISETFFTNSTQYTVKVNAYVGGVVYNDESFELEASEKRKVAYVNMRGISKGASYGRINQPIDSFVVTFDNVFSIVHYKPTLVGINPKRYLYESRRNIYNDTSYTLTVKKQTDTEKNVEFDYVFTEQDYLDAK